MKKQQFKRWQVLLGVIGFMALMGIVGSIDRESQEALQDKAPHIIDHVYVAGR